MNLQYTTQFKIFIFFFSCIILRGVAIGSNEPIKPSDKFQKEVENKSVIDILTIANAYSYKDLKLSLAYANYALEKAKNQKNYKDIFDAQRAIGFIYEDNIMVNQAISIYEEAIKTADVLGDSALCTIYTDLAIVNRKVGNYRAAHNYYDKTIIAAQHNNDIYMVESGLHGLGHLHKEVGVYDKAIDYYLQSLNYAEKSNNILDKIVSHNDIADAYLRAKETEKALEHVEIAYKLALNYNSANPNEEQAILELASVINRHGQILEARKDYDAALKKHEEALTAYQGASLKSYIARSLMHIANVYLLKGDFKKADITFKECLKYEKQFHVSDLAELYSKMGMYYTQNNQLALAEQAFNKSLILANKYDYKDVAQRVNYQMFLIFFKQHDNEKALKYLNTHSALSDSLYNTEKTRRTAAIEFKFDIEKKENEIQAFKLRENSSRLRENRMMLIGSVIAFIMIVLFLVYSMHVRGKNLDALQRKNDEIQQQYRKLEESNEILSQFAYVAAHDLKEPLRSIGSYIGLIQLKHGKTLPDDAKEYMRFVNNGVKRMYSLLTDLLDFSQVLAQQPGTELVRPNDILMEVEDNLRSAIEAKNAQIIYTSDLPHVYMNRLHMTQLFQNLIGNALKFTDKPPIVKVDAREDNGNIVMTIEDNGIGISKEYANKVFVLFQQLNKKGQFEGTGIGLTICKNIVEKYNGKIWFDSEENRGTRFYISIPAQAA
jgi:signal transduction histidine kinase